MADPLPKKPFVDLHQAGAQLDSLLDRAHAGEEVIIVKDGKPYARLCPLEGASRRRPGFLHGELGSRFFEPLQPDELEAWGEMKHSSR